MYSKWHLAFKYFWYYLSASNGKGHGIHSPFIFHFVDKLLNDNRHYPEYDKVESIRLKLKDDPAILVVEDLGAGSSVSNHRQRTVSSIAKNSIKSAKYSQLLYRIVRSYNPEMILELGTSLGITTSYLSLANPAAKIITMEGAGAVAARAKMNFEELDLKNISVIEGNFDKTLPVLLNEVSAVDLTFIDGNHREEPTIRYFNQLLPKMENDSILIFDDIHWSGEMEQAWETIKADPSVRCTIDLFFLGIVFFREEFKVNQHFNIRF